MSVIVMLRLDVDPKQLEEFAAANPDRMAAVRDQAVGHGLIAHRFLGTDNGQTMVVDEWESADEFQAFFEATREDIGAMMSDAGLSGEPKPPEFWHVLESHDKYGWES